MEDPSWLRNCDLLVSTLHSLERKTVSIRRSTKQIVSLRDIAKQREKVRQIMGGANTRELQEIRDTLGLMEKYMRLKPAELRAQGAKLTAEAKAAIEKYQQTCDAFYKKCIRVEESLRARGGTTHVKVCDRANFSSDVEDADENSDLLQRRVVAAPTQKEVFENALYDEIMEERQRETAEITENVKDIREIFNHINLMVNEQGETLNIIEDNVSIAQNATQNAANNLRQAQQYQRAPLRKSMLLILVIILVVVGFFVVFLS